MTKPVRFADGLSLILKEAGRVALEIGSGTMLCSFARKVDSSASLRTLSSLSSSEESDPDGAVILRSLGQLWLWGKRIDWAALHAREKRGKVSLPTYPFERSRFWLDDRQREGTSAGAHAPANRFQLHPLVDSNESTLDEVVFKKTFTGNEPFLKDHLIGKRKILPGVVSMEMARAAGELASKGSLGARLMSAAWARPIAVEHDPLDVFITFSKAKGGLEYEISSGDRAHRILHVRGKLHQRQVGPTGRPGSVRLDEIKKRCDQKSGGREELYGSVHSSVEYGETMQAIHELFSNDNEALAHLKLTPAFSEGFNEYVLHPCLLDGALQTVRSFVQRQTVSYQSLYLPYSVSEVEILKPLTPDCFAYLELLPEEPGSKAAGIIKKFNISVVDLDGNILVQLREYMVKAIDLESFSTPASDRQASSRAPLLYEPGWQLSNLPKAASPGLFGEEVRSLVLFCFNDNGEQLRDQLQTKLGGRRPVILVKCGTQFSELDHNLFLIDPQKQQDCHELLETLHRRHIQFEHVLCLASEFRPVSDSFPIPYYAADLHFIFLLSQAFMLRNPEGQLHLLYLHHGDENEPQQAAVAGFARSVRRENPRFTCRSIQVPREDNDIARVADILQDEFLSPAADQMEVSYKNGQRFVQRIQEFQAGRNVVNPVESESGNRPSLIQIIEHLETRNSEMCSEYGLAKYRDLFPQLDSISVSYVHKAFGELGWRFAPGQRISINSIAQEWGIVPSQVRLFGRLCEMLAEEGTLRKGDVEWEVCHELNRPDPQTFLAELISRYPAFEADLALLGRCGASVAKVLRGQQNPLELLFPQGSLSAVEGLYEGSPFSRLVNSLVGEAVSRSQENSSKERKLRILEVGAGTGSTTSYVLPKLPPDRTEYTFTDVSPFFMGKARRKFRDYPFLRCQLLDLELDPEKQGFAGESFDVILAANVLHATSDLRRTLNHLRQVLAPEGLLVLLEGTGRQRSADLVFGLTEGWWKFKDTDLRASYPLISQSQWLELLKESDFLEAALIPRDDESASLLRQSIVMARGSRAEKHAEKVALRSKGTYLISGGAGGLGLLLAGYLAERFNARLVLIGRTPLSPAKSEALQAIEERGAEVLYLQADVTKLEAIRGAVREAKDRFHALDGVFHCAGILEDRSFLKKTAESFHRVLAPKIDGTVNLDIATRDEKLDFFAMFSSLSALIGTPGQSDYAAGNAFMDGFVEYREKRRAAGKRSGFTLSINWLLWERSSQLMTHQLGQVLANMGLKPLTTEMGLQALEDGLRSRTSRLIVVGGNKAKIERLFVGSNAVDAETTHSSGVDFKGNAGSSEGRVREVLREKVSEILGMEKEALNTSVDMGTYGLDSVSIIDFISQINKHFGLNVSPAIYFEHKSVENLAAHLVEQYPEAFRQYEESSPGKEGSNREDWLSGSQFSESVQFIESSRTGSAGIVSSGSPQKREPIAVIGMSGVFPQSPDLDSFWRNLEAGKDLIREVPKERWDWKAFFGDPQKETNKTNIKWGGFIEDADKFDALFFNISPREAEVMDPQQRLFLETVWKTIEDAGYRPSSLAGTNTGIFVGITTSDYAEWLHRRGQVELYSGTGISFCMLPNRISYLLNFHGPSEPVDTACSSSLVALHRAVEAISNGECEQAIAGGVNLMLSPSTFVYFSKSGLLSQDGRCKAFDKRANGYVRGEGSGAILLKPLSKALAAGDHVYGLIIGGAVNHGGRTKSVGAPSPALEAEVVVKAFEKAQIDPESVTYIEAHGTGTALGDPVEINGLKKAFAQLNSKLDKQSLRKHYCGVGSVKTNIGHLESAAGIAGVIKVLLALRHGKIPASIQFSELNPFIDIKDSPFFIVDQTRNWEAVLAKDGERLPRRAGVSSFGFGGVNAHIVIEEYHNRNNAACAEEQQGPQLFVLSARNVDRLREYARLLAGWIRENYGLDGKSGAPNGSGREVPGLGDVAFTLQVGREEMDERLALVASSVGDLCRKLETWLESGDTPGVFRGRTKSGNARPVPGDGRQSGPITLPPATDSSGLERVAARWVEGAAIDWDSAPGKNRGLRGSLPTYPFARQRHWFPDLKAPSAVDEQSERERLSWILDQVAADQLTMEQAGELINQRSEASG